MLNAQTLRFAALQTGIAAATLWDYRFADIRGFDLYAAVALAYVCLTPDALRSITGRGRAGLLLFATIEIYAAVGLILYGHKSSLAIAAFAGLAFVYLNRDDWAPRWPIFSALVVVHIAFFVVQLLAHKIFGKLVDFQAFTGNTSRIIDAFGLRPAGLFQEPNSYCLNIFVLSSLAIVERKNWLLVAAAVATMIASQSLWGIGAGFFLSLLAAVYYTDDLRILFWRSLVIMVVAGAALNAYLWLTKPPNLETPLMYDRIRGVLHEPSARARYIENVCTAEEISKLEPRSAIVKATEIVFGSGLSTVYFTKCLPANGISLLFKSFGMAGLIALVAGLYSLFSRLPRRRKFYCSLALLFPFTTYPLVTYMIFWIWLAALVLMVERRPSSHSTLQTPSLKSFADTLSGSFFGRRMSVGATWGALWRQRGRSHAADLLYTLVVLLSALGTIAATRPDADSAKAALDATGLRNVRVHTLIMPCHSDRGWSLYGVFFDASISSAQAVNRACFSFREKSWTISGPFDGF